MQYYSDPSPEGSLKYSLEYLIDPLNLRKNMTFIPSAWDSEFHYKTTTNIDPDIKTWGDVIKKADEGARYAKYLLHKDNSGCIVHKPWPNTTTTPPDLTRPSIQEILATLPKIEEKDPNGTDAHAPGAKLDAGKLQPWLFLAGFSNALTRVAEVTTVGAQKYTRNGWVEVPDGEQRYMEAFGRHMLEYGQGKVIDDGPKGTGCLHLAQMIWNLLAVLELQQRKKMKNDPAG